MKSESSRTSAPLPRPSGADSSDSPRPAILSQARHPKRVVIVGVTAVLVVTIFGLLAARSATVTQLEQSIDVALNGLHTGVIGSVASGIYAVFSPLPAVIITAVIASLVWIFTRQLRVAVTFGVVVAATWLPSAIIKALVHRVRPDSSTLPHPVTPFPVDASYPSGHAVFITALVIAVFFLVRGRLARGVTAGVGTVVVVVVVFALLIDGVHFPTDVLASIVWSLGVAPLVLMLWSRFVIPRTYRATRAEGAA
jgi:membrane-associated phospholipid phosphatase